MDDEGDSSGGLSGWAGFTLGRMAAEHERSVEQTLKWFGRPLRRRVAGPSSGFELTQTDYQKVLNENEQLRNELADYKRNYESLHAWAEKAGPEIDRLRADLETSRQDHARLRAWGNEVEPLLAQLKKQSD